MSIANLTNESVQREIEQGAPTPVFMMIKDGEAHSLPIEVFGGKEKAVEFLGEMCTMKGVEPNIMMVYDAFYSSVKISDGLDYVAPSKDPNRKEAVLILRVDLGTKDLECAEITFMPYTKKGDKYIWDEVHSNKSTLRAHPLLSNFADGYVKGKTGL